MGWILVLPNPYLDGTLGPRSKPATNAVHRMRRFPTSSLRLEYLKMWSVAPLLGLEVGGMSGPL